MSKRPSFSAFLSGILARDLARKLHLPGWEHFYIDAMFYNFGRLLEMYYLPAKYAACRLLMERKNADEVRSSRRVLGVSLNELGISVAKCWGLPEKIIVSMELPDEKKLKKGVKKSITINCCRVWLMNSVTSS